MASGVVTVNIIGDASRLKSALGESESALGRFSGRMQDVGKSIMGIGAKMTLGITAPLALLGKAVFDSASNMNETLSKSNTIFGEQASAMERWASTAAKAFGQSKQQALDAAASFGNLFQQLGVDPLQTSHMSASLTQLASDFASFHNADPAAVIESIGAAFRGEFDSVQKFVPTINAAAVQAKAMAMGLAATTDELDEQDKALATYQLLVEGAGAAQGDFARTADGAANKQRILKAQFADAAATLGQKLLPIGKQLLEWATKLIEKFNTLTPQQQKMVLIGAALAAALGPLVTIIGALVTVIGLLISPVGLIVVGIAALVAGVIYAYTHFETFRETVDNVLATIRTSIEAFVAVVTAAWQLWGDDLMRIVTGVWQTIYGIVSGALQVISGIIAVVTGIIHGDWAMVWDGIKQIFSGVWDAIVGILQGFVNVVLGIFGGLFDALRNAVSAGLESVLTFFRELPGNIVSAIGDLGRVLYDAGRSLIQGLIDGIQDMIPSIPNPLDYLPGLPFDLPSVDIPGFDHGGIVPGRRGAPRLIMAHGGETVLPTHKATGATPVAQMVEEHIHIHIGTREVAEEIRHYNRSLT